MSPEGELKAQLRFSITEARGLVKAVRREMRNNKPGNATYVFAEAAKMQGWAAGMFFALEVAFDGASDREVDRYNMLDDEMEKLKADFMKVVVD